MSIAMLLVLVVPLAFAVSTIVDYADDIVTWAKVAVEAGVPPPPEWVGRIPLVGSKLLRRWQELAATGRDELAAQAVPRRLLRSVEHERQRLSLNEVARRARKAWHGVKLLRLDWGASSHSVAFGLEFRQEGSSSTSS